MMNVLEPALESFRACLQSERFYEAHEVLEALWFPRRFERNAEVLLLKGFINAAVSFELHKRHRFERSDQVWRTYQKYAARLLHVMAHKRPFYERANHVILNIKEHYVHI